MELGEREMLSKQTTMGKEYITRKKVNSVSAYRNYAPVLPDLSMATIQYRRLQE